MKPFYYCTVLSCGTTHIFRIYKVKFLNFVDFKFLALLEFNCMVFPLGCDDNRTNQEH